jgi:hypothetical protein
VCGCGAGSGVAGVSSALAVLEAEAVAVHLEDVNVVGEAVEPRTSVHSAKGCGSTSSIHARSVD